MQFKAGDKVIFDEATLAEVQFGPVRSNTGKDAYLVKWLETAFKGCSALLWADQLQPAPKFEVGQAVKFTYDIDVMHVVAGPFSSENDNLWVVKDEKGNHFSSTEECMVPVVE